MKLIKKDKINAAVKDGFKYPFEVPKNGIYLIEVIANAQDWRQNLKKIWQHPIKNFWSFFKDDDLVVKLDNISFPGADKSWLDIIRWNENEAGEAAWNGNNLKGLFKTNLIIAILSKDGHALTFSTDQTPFLRSIAIFTINGGNVSYAPKENNPAEDGDRRQWMTVVLADLPLKKLEIKAAADKKESDDEDIKLIIDGKTIVNNDTKWHKNWYWCGRLLLGQVKVFKEELNLPQGFHYIELWSDKTPKLNSITIILGKTDEEAENKKDPGYIIRKIESLYGEIGQEIKFNKIPSPLEDFNGYDKEIVVASNEFGVEPAILKATIAQESSFGTVVDHDSRYIGESGLMGLEKKNSVAQLAKLGYIFNYNDVQDVIRASAAYYKWLVDIELERFKDSRNPLKLYTQYSKDLKARNTNAPGIKEFLYYYFFYK